MLKISFVDGAGDGVTLRLEGRVAGLWVDELQTAYETLLKTGQSIKLNLAGVSFADQRGVALLSSLGARGILMMEGSPFLKEQLKPAGMPD